MCPKAAEFGKFKTRAIRTAPASCRFGAKNAHYPLFASQAGLAAVKFEANLSLFSLLRQLYVIINLLAF